MALKPFVPAALVLVAASAASAASAQEDLRDMLFRYAETSACSADMSMLSMLIVDGMGRTETDLQALVNEVVAAGEAELSPDGSAVTVLPPLCEDVGGISLAMGSGYLEGIITARDGCRAGLAEVRAEFETGGGMGPEAFDRVLADLVANETVVIEGEDVVHPGCGPLPASEAMEAVERMRPSFSHYVAMRAMDAGCRLSLADRDGLVEDLTADVVATLGVEEALPEGVLTAIRDGMEEVLDNPAPPIEIDAATGDLLLPSYCQP